MYAHGHTQAGKRNVLHHRVCKLCACECVCLIVSFSFISFSPWLFSPCPPPPLRSFFLTIVSQASTYSIVQGNKKKGWKRERKHNRLVPSLILISSSKFDNYTFRVPHEFLCSVRIREKATDSAVEGSSYYEWLTTVLLPLWSKKFWKREQQRSILYSLFGSVCPHPPHPPSEKPADHISRRAHNPLHNLSPCAAD